jgi:hypothetical protein
MKPNKKKIFDLVKEPRKHSFPYITQMKFKYNSSQKESLLIPIKTIKNYSCLPSSNQIIIYDFNKNKSIKILDIFSNDIISINKVTLDNENYLFISDVKNKRELFLIENDNKLKKVKNSFKKFLKMENIDKFIILDNKDLVAVVGKYKLSFYLYKNGAYHKYFNNINKDNEIFDLHKLEDNKYIYLSHSYKCMALNLFNADFSSKRILLETEKPIESLKSNNLFFIKNNKIIIIGKKKFIVFNLDAFEEQTFFELGIICYVLPFNNNDIDKSYYDYFALIFKEEKEEEYYLKIYCLLSNDIIEETNKINLKDYSTDFKSLLHNEDTSKNKNQKDENNTEDFRSYDQFILDEKIYFDMVYDINDDGKVILIINFSRSDKKKSTIRLNIDLENMEFI